MKLDRGTGDFSNCTQHEEGLMKSAPMMLDGIVFLPASDLRIGRAQIVETDDFLVQLDLIGTSPLGNSLGLFVRLTPDAARKMAVSLCNQADKVDAIIAHQASAAIEKARNTGGAS